MSFFVFARPAILKLSGVEGFGDGFQPLIRASIRDSYEGKQGLTHFLRVRVSKEKDGTYGAMIVKPTDAYYSSWLGSANGIAILDENRTVVHEGDYVDVSPIGQIT